MNLFEEMGKKIKEDKRTKPFLKQMVSDGLSEDEAINIMLLAWIYRMNGEYEEI
jgi:hypothetical protein